MDPEAALANLRELCAQVLEGDEEGDPTLEDSELRALEIAEQFQALDEWLCRGGFKPKEWA